MKNIIRIKYKMLKNISLVVRGGVEFTRYVTEDTGVNGRNNLFKVIPKLT